ncbi:MAG: hypothetical protein KDD69_14600, partial [Bdellovibrionales bacterium]|nr:hypothetical protein [Bdellovibrionales bacterium]
MTLTDDSPGREKIDVPRVAICGTKGGAGVSSVTLGLLLALKKAGGAPTASKIGPGLVTTTHHRRVTGRLSHTLDAWMLGAQGVQESFARSCAGAELALVEGQAALFDRHCADSSIQREVDVLKALRLPVILVFDARGLGATAETLLSGYLRWDPEVRIRGVIANYVRDAEHQRQIREAVSKLPGVSYLGGIFAADGDRFGGRASIQLNRNPSLLTRNQLIRLGGIIEKEIDLAAVQRIAEEAEPFTVDATVTQSASRRCRIAVADDQAFHLTIQDNLDLLRRAGAELVPFSPLVDKALPENVQGVYLSSGYLHLYAEDLASNVAMLTALRAFVQRGEFLYAEGAAVAYLSDRVVRSDGATLPMARITGATALSQMQDYEEPETTFVEAAASDDSALAEHMKLVRGFRANRWTLRQDRPLKPLFRVREQCEQDCVTAKAETVTGEGVIISQKVFGTMLQLHWG